MKPNDIEARVLGSIGKKLSENAGAVAPGSYNGEFLCRVQYSATKGADYETVPTVNILSKATLAKAMVMSGIQAPNFLANLCTAAKQALLAGDKVADTLTEADQRVVEQMDKLFAEVSAQLPKQPRAGAFTGSVTLEIVPPNQTVA